MGPGSSQRGNASIRRWLGWTRDVPTVAIGLDDDVATVLCLRRQTVITASGRASLAPGTVRDGQLRAVGPAIDALAELRSRLHLPTAAAVIMVVEPRRARVEGQAIVAEIEADELSARAQVTLAAGLQPPRFDPTPAALARLGPAVDGPVYADGAGWRTYRDHGHLEIEPSDRRNAEPLVGPSPVERGPLGGPAPIAVDRGVVLAPGWPILLGAALADNDIAPPARIEETQPVAAGGWAIEQVSDRRGAGR